MKRSAKTPRKLLRLIQTRKEQTEDRIQDAKSWRLTSESCAFCSTENGKKRAGLGIYFSKAARIDAKGASRLNQISKAAAAWWSNIVRPSVARAPASGSGDKLGIDSESPAGRPITTALGFALTVRSSASEAATTPCAV